MANNIRMRIGDILKEQGIVTEEDIVNTLANRLEGERLGDALIRLNVVNENQMLSALEKTTNTSRVNLASLKIDLHVLELFTGEFCKENLFFPIKLEDNEISIALNDPLNYFVIDEIRFKTGYEVKVFTALKADILSSIEKSYSLSKVISDIESDNRFVVKQTVQETENSPMIRLVNQIINAAVLSHASDIHIDPGEEQVQVKYRVDSVLYPELTLPISVHAKIVSRVKIMAKLDITETRIPQDGRITAKTANGDVDLRISVLPTINGEKVVIRLLNNNLGATSMKSLGLSKKNEELLTKTIHSPYGIMLVSGPTGSGKSTTLYTVLNTLNDTKRNIITIEDPVEMKIKGINQVQVREDLGLTFAEALRSILRQDPDVIMVGEIRDSETAQIAVRSSLTGHLVFSTIHTNSAADTITRLNDMGIESFLVGNALVGVLAQRLVRKVCPNCSYLDDPTEEEWKLFKRYGIEGVTKIRRASSCEACGNRGYVGRIGIFEYVPVNEELRTMISRGVTADEVKSYMHSHGMKFLIQDGLEKVRDGITTMEEVLSATMDYGDYYEKI